MPNDSTASAAKSSGSPRCLKLALLDLQLRLEIEADASQPETG